MKILKYNMSVSTTEATIKISWIKQITITIPTKKLMYVFADPQTWGEIDNMKITRKELEEFIKVFHDMLTNDNKTLAELLLKVAGKHHNSYENDVFKHLLAGK